MESKKTPSGLERAQTVVAALRGENGCPWDKAQTHESLRRYLLEETYEVLEALDHLKERGDQGYQDLREELGDLLLQVLLHGEIASQSGKFTVDDLAHALADKLIRRHPHVFGENKLHSSEEVLEVWEKNKQKEKPKESVLDGIPPHLPALQRSLKVIEKVSKCGFQWPDLKGPIEKVKEELGEFLEEVEKSQNSTITESHKERIESELGDLIFCLSNVAHFLKINPEDSLRSMLTRFESRFRHVEKRVKESGKKFQEMQLDELDIFWNEAKKLGL